MPPDARTAVAQLRDGRILFYAADLGDGSTGLTIAEVARDLKRRGAVTAMSFDSGGSTSVAIDGRLLNQPSDGVERAVGNQLVYFVGDRGHAQPVARVTVGKPGAGARVPTLSYTTVRPARVSVSLHDPRGRVVVEPARTVAAGVHPIRIPGSAPLVTGRWEAIVTALQADTDVSASLPGGQGGAGRPAHAGRPGRADARPAPAGPAGRRAPAAHADITTRWPWVLLCLGVALTLHRGAGRGAGALQPPLASAPMELPELVAAALAEDVGAGDVTTQATIPADARASATIVQKQPGVIYGLDAVRETFRQLDPGACRSQPRVEEGMWREGGEVAHIEGPARALLTGERTALNLLGRLSGVATAAAIAVRAVEGTGATILDTRKTTPGLRMLEKAAVRAGGAANHRIGLFDAVLIKENHVAAAGGITAAVRRRAPGQP